MVATAPPRITGKAGRLRGGAPERDECAGKLGSGDCSLDHHSVQNSKCTNARTPRPAGLSAWAPMNRRQGSGMNPQPVITAGAVLSGPARAGQVVAGGLR